MRGRKITAISIATTSVVIVLLVYLLALRPDTGTFAVSVVEHSQDANGVPQVTFRFTNRGSAPREWTPFPFGRDVREHDVVRTFGWMGFRPSLEPGNSELLTLTLPADGRMIVRLAPVGWRSKFRDWPKSRLGQIVLPVVPSTLRAWPCDFVSTDFTAR